MKYKRGDVVRVPFPFTDQTSHKKRPALVISNNEVNQTGDYLLMMITSKVKNDGLSIELTDSDYIRRPLEFKSYARVHKIGVFHESLIIKKDTSVTEEFMSYVIRKLNTLISDDSRIIVALRTRDL